MKYVILPLIVILIFTRSGLTQSHYADSLVRVTAGLPDNSEKADNYIQLARYYLSVNRDSLWQYAEMADKLARKIDYFPAVADAMHLKSILLKFRDQVDEALVLNSRFLKISDSIHDNVRLAKGFLNRGDLFYKKLEFDTALKYYNTSLDLYYVLEDSNGLGANYNAIGNLYFSKADYDSSAVYFVRAIDIYDRIKQEKKQIIILNNLSKNYMQLGQLELARKYATRCMEYNSAHDNLVDLALDYGALGRIANEEKKYEEALEYFTKSMELSLQLEDTISVSQMQMNIGLIYYNTDNYEKAIEYYDQAYKGYVSKDYTLGIIVVLGNKAVALGHNGRCQEAIALNEKVMQLSKQFSTREYYQDALDNISWCWMKLGNYQKAYDYLFQFTLLKDSITNIEKTKVINELTLKYEKQKDQARILQLENENLEKDLSLRKRTNQRNAYLSTGVFLLALALFLVLYFRQRAAKDKIIAVQKIQQLEEEKKLMAAKLLVEGQEEERKRIARELHDGLGVLLSATKMQFSSIKDSSPENRPLIERATQLLEQATGDVRKISHNMMPGLLTKLGLYEAVEDLIDNLNDSGNINALCQIDENLERLPENKEIMLYRIFQEMVNNTLKHAGAKNIKLRIRAIENDLEILYSDDGKGFDVNTMLESQSIGLKSIQSRINFLNGKLDIHSAPGEGSSYLIQVPA